MPATDQLPLDIPDVPRRRKSAGRAKTADELAANQRAGVIADAYIATQEPGLGNRAGIFALAKRHLLAGGDADVAKAAVLLIVERGLPLNQTAFSRAIREVKSGQNGHRTTYQTPGVPPRDAYDGDNLKWSAS
jgi:hypothetical protein